MDINDHLMSYILSYKKNNNNKSNEIKDNNNNDSSLVNTIILNSAKIYSIEIKNTYQQIECLSLRDSFIKNISFLFNLPNIYYLDLYGNPIENFKPIIRHGTFGFLSISPPLNYFEKQILSLKSLNVVILQAEIKDKGIYNNFIMRNPNILVFNNTIIDFGKKIRTFYTMMNFHYYIQNILLDKEDFPILSNSNNNLNRRKSVSNISPRKSISNETIINRDNFLEKRLKIKKKKVANKKCIEILNFYEEYNNNLFNIFKNNKANFDQHILCVEEKKKFLMIYNTFNYIGHFFSKNNNYYKYLPKRNSLNIDINEIPSSKYPNINIEMFTYLNILQYKEFILSIIILYLFSILSKGITYYLILSIFKKTEYYTKSNKNKNLIESDLKALLDIDKSFLFAFYFKIYDILFEVSGKNIDLNKLYEIQERLKLIVITDKINEILSHQESFIEKYKTNSDISLKNKIITKDFIRFLFEIKIFQKIFNIIQFVNDFIIYNNLLNKLGHDFPEDMQFFTEIQGLLLSNFDKSNEIKESMADKKYNKIQISSLLNNKFFFNNENYKRTNQNNSDAFFNHKKKVFYPSKKRMFLIENMKPLNEKRKEDEEMIKQNYINDVLKSFFQVITPKSNKTNKFEYNNKLKLNNYLILNNKKKINKHKRNISNENLLNNIKNNINKNDFKTYTIFREKNHNFNEENSNNTGRTNNKISKSKLLSSSKDKLKKYNFKNININPELFNKNLFNNDVLSNHFNAEKRNNKNELNKLNISDKFNIKRNYLLNSYDNKKNVKYTNQFSIIVDKKSQNLPCSLRIIKKGKIIKSPLNENDIRVENLKSKILRNVNSVDFNPFSLINKNIPIFK